MRNCNEGVGSPLSEAAIEASKLARSSGSMMVSNSSRVGGGRARVAPEYPVDFVRPKDVPGSQVALEAADLGAPLGAVEIVAAASKLVLDGFQLGDVDGSSALPPFSIRRSQTITHRPSASRCSIGADG